jgi:hypothetical protein
MKATALAALCLLVSVATAYAECAWVFWQEANAPPMHEPSTWPVSAWETKPACEQALAKKMASDTASNSKAKDTEVIAGDMGASQRLGFVPRVALTSLRRTCTSASPTPWTRAGRRGSDDDGTDKRKGKRTKEGETTAVGGPPCWGFHRRRVLLLVPLREARYPRPSRVGGHHLLATSLPQARYAARTIHRCEHRDRPTSPRRAGACDPGPARRGR